MPPRNWLRCCSSLKRKIILGTSEFESISNILYDCELSMKTVVEHFPNSESTNYRKRKNNSKLVQKTLLSKIFFCLTDKTNEDTQSINYDDWCHRGRSDSDTVCDPNPTLTKVTKLFQFKYLVSVLSVFRCINKLLVEQARLWIIHRINTGL